MSVHDGFFNRRTEAADNVVTGADRRGFQGSVEAMVDERKAMLQEPRVDRPAVMIRTLRFVSAKEGSSPAEAMTAKSHALYEYLMASARVDLSSKEEFTVTFKDAKKYLEIESSVRLVEYVDAINATMVTYDFRLPDYQRTGKMPLLMCDYLKDEKTGVQYIAYSMHHAVRTVILEARQYAMYEINAFSKFASKYSARLYPKLALVAGMDVRKPLTYKPDDLARELGWTWKGKFHYGNFENRALRPVLKDFEHVSRFKFKYLAETGKGRGSPISRIVLTVTEARKKLAEYRKPEMTDLERQVVREHDPKFPAHLRPSEDLLRHAAGKTGLSILQIHGGWKEAYHRIAANPAAPIGTKGTCTGEYILMALSTFGVGEAFEVWTDDVVPPKLHSDGVIDVVAAEAVVPIPAAERKIHIPARDPRMPMEKAAQEARQVLNALDNLDPFGGYKVRDPMGAVYYEAYCDPEAMIWVWVDGSQDVASALRILAETELEFAKGYLRRLMTAIVAQDLASVEGIAREITSRGTVPIKPRTFIKRRPTSSIVGPDEVVAMGSGSYDLDTSDTSGY